MAKSGKPQPSSASKPEGGAAPAAGPAPSFNLLDSPWIPVLWRNGNAERVGIMGALGNAGRIRQIAATNPMDNVALLRFLLAVLLWCKPDAKEALGKLLAADAKAPGIPNDWLGNLDRHQSAFELLGPG
ncbi:MAG: type I-E CRISPR-associated protein Cse1/CasA, partial [Planctomycetes bacterium]|nr:type I-E CRISPR-associated protein Cse1/CasA [Planctomycetota bacterium]